MRGQLTEEIQFTAKQYLGYEITLAELRLMPYTQYCLMNEQRYDRAKINQDDRGVIEKWEKKGFITINAFFSLEATQEFWIGINMILWLAYVKKGRREYGVME